MKNVARTLFALSIAILVVMSAPRTAMAQDGFPNSAIRLVVGFPPGGSDTAARLLAQKLSIQMNANVVVDNKPGANGNIGADFVAKSKPDGYTLLFNTSGVILSRAFGEKLSYDVLKDLVPIGLVVSSAQVLVVHPSVPANTSAEFIAYLRANPDKLSYASGGIGNITHLAALLFLQANGLSALHVPYKGAVPAVTDVVGGRVQFTMQSVVSVAPMVKDKRLKALAVTSLKRSTQLPEVPTLAETVMPGFEVGTWFGVMAPTTTSPAIIKRLNVEIVKALQDTDVVTRMAQAGGYEPLFATPDEYGAYLKSELERWTKLIKSADIKTE